LAIRLYQSIYRRCLFIYGGRTRLVTAHNEFISIVSHELRTPLTAIRGSLGLLATGIYDNKPEKAKRMVEIALTHSDRLVRLVNDMLDLERLDSGKVTLVKAVCDMAALMQQADPDEFIK
jgi:signal transduction histidine kinase